MKLSIDVYNEMPLYAELLAKFLTFSINWVATPHLLWLFIIYKSFKMIVGDIAKEEYEKYNCIKPHAV